MSSFLKCSAILPCDLSLITIHISHWRHFPDIRISRGSVATRLRRGEIFKHDFVANLLPSLSVKNVWKSVNIRWSYGQEFGVLFFDLKCILLYLTAERWYKWWNILTLPEQTLRKCLRSQKLEPNSTTRVPTGPDICAPVSWSPTMSGRGRLVEFSQILVTPLGH